ncbi:MAG: serine hydrolase [Gammaproteobacteria bacterium]|nr:serine hydrolase [Gammaproteobacteria bacterium]
MRLRAGILGWSLAAWAAASPVHLSLHELRTAGGPTGVVDNSAFTPAADAAPAHEHFVGTLRLGEAPMATRPATFGHPVVLGKNTQLFPAVALTFITVGDDLVPATQEVIRSGFAPKGHSYWDVIVQPGRIWSEPGDGGWSRAAFPFALVNSLEGETHNGVAVFAYLHGAVSRVRYQIVQQTAPFYVPDLFTAAGDVPAHYQGAAVPNAAQIAETYRRALTDEVRMAPWQDLKGRVDADVLEAFDRSLPPRDGVAAGLDDGHTFYLKYCASAGGQLPWCERARFGVWSATKALCNAVALLRLAQKFGPEVFELRISDYVPQAARHPGWQAVRFIDALNMATGIGNGSTRVDPNSIDDGYLEGSYDRWYAAHSKAEKVRALLETGAPYPWGPGRIARYRDQDMFVLGVAMDAYLKSRAGPDAELWSMLESEVYGPIGIHYAPTNRTIERTGPGHPLMAFGYYPSLGDMVKIARLFHSGGRHGSDQILYGPTVAALLAGRAARGLPTGKRNAVGETTYFDAFWNTPFLAAEGCRIYLPAMQGWGGNIIALLPGALTAVRVAKEVPDNPADDPTDMARVANRLANFCP